MSLIKNCSVIHSLKINCITVTRNSLGTYSALQKFVSSYMYIYPVLGMVCGAPASY